MLCNINIMSEKFISDTPSEFEEQEMTPTALEYSDPGAEQELPVDAMASLEGSDVSREMLEEIEAAQFSSEDISSIESLYNDAQRLQEIATAEGAPRSAREAAFANALLAAGEEERIQIEEAQAIVSQPDPESGFASWASKKGKNVMAMMALVAGLGAFSQTANAGGLDDFFKTVSGSTAQKTFGKINEGINTKIRFEEIDRRIQSTNDQIDRLEQEKQLLLSQGEAAYNQKNIENSVDSRVKPLEIEAKYKAQRAQLEVRKEDSKKHFLQLPNPTSADLARYEAEQAQISANIARLEGDYQKNIAREDVRSATQQGRVGLDTANANNRIHGIEMQQARLKNTVQQLQTQKIQLIQRAAQVISR